MNQPPNRAAVQRRIDRNQQLRKAEQKRMVKNTYKASRSFSRKGAVVAKGSRVKKARFSVTQRGDRVVVSGTDYLATVSVTRDATPGTVIWDMFVDLPEFASARLGQMAVLYEKYHIDRFSVSINGSQPATAAEQLLLAYDADPSDEVASGDDGIHQAMASTNSGVFKSWESAEMEIPAHRMDKWLYTNFGEEVVPSTSRDARLSTAGYLYLMAITPVLGATTPLTLGTIWVDYQITFDIPQLARQTPESAIVQGSQTAVVGGSYFLNNSEAALLPQIQTLTAGYSDLVKYFPTLEKVMELDTLNKATGKTGVLNILLPAGKYIFDSIFTAQDAAHNPASRIANNSASFDRFSLTPTATAKVGSANPLTNAFAAYLHLPGTGAPVSEISGRGYFELATDAFVDFLVSGAKGFVTTGTAIATLLATVDVRKINDFAHTGWMNLGNLGVAANGGRARACACTGRYGTSLATNGSWFAWFPDGSELPEGWTWVVSTRSNGQVYPQGQGAGPACDPDDVDIEECEAISRASSTSKSKVRPKA